MILVELLAVTVAGTLLKKFTRFSDAIVPKFVPSIVTGVPMGPDDGVKLVMVCGGKGVAFLNF